MPINIGYSVFHFVYYKYLQSTIGTNHFLDSSPAMEGYLSYGLSKRLKVHRHVFSYETTCQYVYRTSIAPYPLTTSCYRSISTLAPSLNLNLSILRLS